MPQRIVCEKCGELLYSGLELKPPEEIIQALNGKCLKCGKKLFFNPSKVEIKVL